MKNELYVLILAGGSGERFWPLSRNERPKQLLNLFSSGTLLTDTIARLEGLVPKENILILTNHVQEKAVRSLCPDLPAPNIVAEPAKRDTAAAIALGAAWISLRNQKATMAVLPADHLIRDKDGFHRTLRAAAAAAEQTGDLVTIGIDPTWACPSFGYIEEGPDVTIPGAEDATIREVRTFREKPNPDLAEKFLQEGTFRWNAGMFIWSINSIIKELNRHAPAIAGFLSRLHESGDFDGVMREHFPTLPKVSIDYAIMEKASRVLVVRAAFDWDDVGTWTAVAKYFDSDARRNASNTALTTLDAEDNIVFSHSKSHVALLGVRDLIVVEAGDALLVCHASEAEKIKALVKDVPPDLQ